MVALFRIAKYGPSTDGSDVIAGVLLAITLLASIAPGGLYLFPPPWDMVYAIMLSFIWLLLMPFLLYEAHHKKTDKIFIEIDNTHKEIFN